MLRRESSGMEHMRVCILTRESTGMADLKGCVLKRESLGREKEAEEAYVVEEVTK
jgi:hypothetical protein